MTTAYPADFPIPPCKRVRHRDPVSLQDLDGKQIVGVPCRGGMLAQIELPDFESIMAAGVTDQWFQHSNGSGKKYPCAAHPTVKGDIVRIARIILKDIPRGKHVKFRDNNPFNLRRSNLYWGLPAIETNPFIKERAERLKRERAAKKQRERAAESVKRAGDTAG